MAEAETTAATARMQIDLKAAARDLGIKGISRMRKHELVEAVERVDPQFRQPWLDLAYGVQRRPNSSFPRTGRNFGKNTG